MEKENTGKFKSRLSPGEKPIGIKQQRKVLDISNKWDKEAKRPIKDYLEEE